MQLSSYLLPENYKVFFANQFSDPIFIYCYTFLLTNYSPEKLI